MKSVLFLALMATTFAQAQSTASNITVDATNNADGTVTIRSPKLLRGNKSFPFSSSNSPSAICKAMGFENVLEQSNFTVNDNGKIRALVNTEGLFSAVTTNGYHSLSEITCYNGVYQTSSAPGEIIENADQSYTLVNPKLVRGSKTYPFSSSNNINLVCQAMGFKEGLSGTEATTNDNGMTRALLNTEGSFSSLTTNGYYSYKEVSCVRSKHVTVVQDQNGKKYLRRDNLSSMPSSN